MIASVEPYAKDDHTHKVPVPCRFGHSPSVFVGVCDVFGHILEKSANFRPCPCDSHQANADHQFIPLSLLQNFVPFFAVMVDPPLHGNSVCSAIAGIANKHIKTTITFFISNSLLLKQNPLFKSGRMLRNRIHVRTARLIRKP